PQPLAASIASSNTALLALIKREQTAFLQLAQHFDAFQLDVSACPRVAATLATIRQTISHHASALKSRPATVPAPSQRSTTWASVAGRSASKAAPQTAMPPPSLPKKPVPKSSAAIDLRVMVRLPQDSPTRQLSAGALLTQTRQIVGGDAFVRNVQFVRSGFALLPFNEAAHEHLLAQSAVLQQYFGATSVDAQSTASRDTFIIPYAPLAGSLSAYAEELSTILSVPVVSARMAPNNTEDT
ncbi:hypothetical protein KEM55_006321, partial [Ascosphaera atra]